MNDRYLYRAKRTDNGEWVEGNLVWSDDADDDYKAIIIPTTGSNMFTKSGSNVDLGFEKWYRVDSSTICQCTGLKDKNGKLIWENDIVFVTDDDGNSGQIDTGVGEINFLEGLWYISGTVQNALYDINKVFNIEVTGNIFDEGSENIGKRAEEN